ncbi:hypothetical protein [Glycomyces paridis]|uniref:Uncharacterized protein n=1 Tax=Glycomyces paridis TaxID=2126555 RepID=A0A4S8P9J0_9ACTN|nr:hypothetical protein [Glycomyces paridis]THV26245.1 hypothetical protein E9998_19315 [Glycomyces paridis]
MKSVAGVRAWVRWAAAALAGAVACLAVAAPVSAAPEDREAAGVVVIGIPGLAWSDIDPEATPHLWGMAGTGASAAMSVRTIGSWTCPEAAWVSLGAGERAGGAAPRDAQCVAQSQIPAPEEAGGSWTVGAWEALIEANSAYNYGARLGSLADAIAISAAEQAEAAEEAAEHGEEAPVAEPGSCVAGIGNGAALAAADTEGRVAFWAPTLDSLGAAMAACDIVVVDPGVVVGDSEDRAPDATTDYDQLGSDDTEVGDEPSVPEGEHPGEIVPDADPVRVSAAKAADAAVGRVAGDLPGDWRLIVAGIADASAPSALHPVLYTGAGVEAGGLTSSTTGRDGYVQLVDITATALSVVGAELPATVAGAPVTVLPDPDRTSEAAVRAGVDETAAATAVATVDWWFYAVVSFLGCVAVGFAVWLLRGGDRWRRTAQTVCVAVAAVPVAGVAAGIPPWWRSDQPALVFWAVIAAGVALLTVAASLPQTRTGARPALVVAGAAAALIVADQVSGATWPLHTPMGYTAQVGARFTGLGNYAFSVFAAAVILLIAFVPWRGRSRIWGPVALGLAAVVIVGAPMLGRDMGGTLTLVAAVILTCLRLWGRRLTVGAVALAGSVALAAFAIGGFLDYLRPEEDQTHLGRFIGSVLDGTAAQIVVRKADASLSTIGKPLTWVCLAALIGAYLIWRRRAPIRSDRVGAAVVGLAAVALIGALVNDSGIAIPGFTATVGFGLLAVAVGPLPGPRTAPETAETTGVPERA